MIGLLDNIYQISGVVLIACAVYYYVRLRKMNRERKLTKVERSVYIITQIAFLCWAGSSLLMILDKSY